MGDKALRKGLSITAIVLVIISAILMSLTNAESIVYGTGMIFYGAPFIAAAAIPLLVVLIVLSRYCYKTDTLQDMIATIGVRYAIFGWFYIFMMKSTVAALYLFCYDFFSENYSSIYLILNSLNVCVGGTLVLSIVLRKVPRYIIPKRKMKFGYLLLLIMMMYGVTLVGMLMGLPIHLVLSSIRLQSTTDNGSLGGLMMNSGQIIMTVTIGILPAIFEELLFRKFLIDRTIRHGEFISCAMSGIMFGLWHGNFQQFFFAFFVGVMFAFVYIRTGKIIYTMIMHASMNLVTTTVTMQLLLGIMRKMGYDASTGTMAEMSDMEMFVNVMPLILLLLIWLLFLLSFQIAGLVVVIVKRKWFKLAKMIGEPDRKIILHTLTHSVEMWIFFSFAIFLFLYYYLPDILSVFIAR